MTVKGFFKNILFIALFAVLVMVLVIFWLRFYTNHGQKLELPDFTEMQLEEASALAQQESFSIVVNDSIHIIGKEGGMIIDQNPKASSKVKENRKVYVSITKYNADKIDAGSLPTLYGRSYDQKSKELSYMGLSSKIKEYKYDPGEPNHILEVWYKGKQIIGEETIVNNVEIEKGGTLDFVLSKRIGGVIAIPNLVCMDKTAAVFLLEQGLRLKVGNMTGSPDGFISAQIPAYDPNGTMQIGQSIDLVISETKPLSCN